ncbi:hypothetical protein F5Y18DRAFT_431484 [Xylariaceae sp. FL1019]|nr:hypothetical protein F5Y18DRAFT_431484 [Xylariaceae sp. FL1019]
MSIDKKEESQERSEESVASTPDTGNGPDPSAAQQDTQPVKRKGGRKPIYATSEERKQRNRQAQAAFRERRTEYIKQLEDTIRVHEQNLTNLQSAHRNAADECLMLRYKNSLLERILLEKGIDVQAELQAKTGSPNLGPTHIPPSMMQPPPMQRTILSRQHNARRSASSLAPKLEPGATSMPQDAVRQSVASPKTRPTPPTHTASPTNPVPPYSGHVSAASPTGTATDHGNLRTIMAPSMKQPMAPMAGTVQGARHPMMHQQQQHQHHQHHQHHPQHPPGPRSPALYPTASFQNHYQQLGKLTQQEYDAPTDMMDDTEHDGHSQPPYSSGYSNAPAPGMSMPPPTSAPSAHPPTSSTEHPGQQQQHHGQFPSMTQQLLDPTLDWDPFGLNASMAFPQQFSGFDTSNTR